MPETARILRAAAQNLTWRGLHTGDQFASPTGALDVCAAIYTAAHGTIPHEFHTDEVASIALIEASAPAMAAIRAVSASLESEPCTTEICPGHEVPDYIEHVSNWAATAPINHTEPPTESEVIGRLYRLSHQLAATVPPQRPAA